MWNANTKSCTPYLCALLNCNKCQTNSTKCEECKNGTILFLGNGGCLVTEISNCQVLSNFSGSIQCIDCVTGFSVDTTTWLKCNKLCQDSNCQSCPNDTNICLSCPNGYLLKKTSSTQTLCQKIAVYLPNCLSSN